MKREILGLFFDLFCEKKQKNNNVLQVEPLAPFGRVDFGEIKLLLSLEIINDSLAKVHEKNYERTRSTLPNPKKRYQKWVASPPILRAGFRILEGCIRTLLWFFLRISKRIINHFRRQ